jgi:hypothetical protein
MQIDMRISETLLPEFDYETANTRKTLEWSGVQLRLHDIPVPSIYGPSGDEAAF